MPGGTKHWNGDELRKLGRKVVNTEVLLGTNTNVGFVVVPFDGVVEKIYSVIDGATTTANEVLSFAVTGGTTMGDVTIATSSSAGDVDSLTPVANVAVVAGDTIDVTTDGGNATTTTISTITVVIREV